MMNKLASSDALGELLNRLHDRHNTPEFVADDPISVPHRFFERGSEVQSRQNDIEIAGFLTATIAWGNRKAIVKSAGRMIDLMENAPYDFVMNTSPRELDAVLSYVHRTFNGGDLRSFILSLRHIYNEFGSMKAYFEGEYRRSCRDFDPENPDSGATAGEMRVVISRFRRDFFTPPHALRCEKHLSSVDRGAACKRTCMFLRWMVRRDDRGVDFGLWSGIPPSALYLPLDVHSAATARSLGLLSRRQNDWKAVEQVTARLREFDPEDPVRFDFALFGAGINNEIPKVAGGLKAPSGI